MSKTTSYADLGKAPADLAGKGFPAPSTFKINHEASIPCGAVFKSAFSSDTKGQVSFSVEPEYKTSVESFPLLFKGKWTSEHEAEVSLAANDLISKGTELKPWFKHGKGQDKKSQDEKIFVKTGGVQIGFVNNQVNFSAKTESPSDFSEHKVDASLVVQPIENLFLGANAVYTHKPQKKESPESDSEDKKPSPWLLQGRVHYAQANSSLSLAYEVDPKSKEAIKLPQFGITWFQKVDSDLSVATGFIIPAGGKPPTCTFTSERKWDSTTSVKSKVSVGPKNRIAVAYTQTVTPYAVLSLGADLNANKLVGSSGGDASDHSFGFELKLK